MLEACGASSRSRWESAALLAGLQLHMADNFPGTRSFAATLGEVQSSPVNNGVLSAWRTSSSLLVHCAHGLRTHRPIDTVVVRTQKQATWGSRPQTGLGSLRRKGPGRGFILRNAPKKTRSQSLSAGDSLGLFEYCTDRIPTSYINSPWLATQPTCLSLPC